MNKDMLWLACWHHILEIMLEAVVSLSLGPSSGPDIFLLKRFKKSWSAINRTNYQTAQSDATATNIVNDFRDELIAFAEDWLLMFQPRDDYRKLIELTVIFLGQVPPKCVSFKAPYGLHRARWMAKIIYSMKIWMFREQFKITKREEKGLLDVCLFAVRVYIRYWFKAPSATSTPRNDLMVLKDLDNYKTENKDTSQFAMKKILGHLWYLLEELKALAFFDSGVSFETKRNMVHALQMPGKGDQLKRITVDTAMIQKKQLEDFVTNNTLRFFTITGIPSDYLQKDVAEWEEDKLYQSVKASICCMRVVNNIAERGGDGRV